MSFFRKLKEKITGTNEAVTEKFKDGLSKTRNQFTSKVNDLVARFREVDEEFLKSWKNCSCKRTSVLKRSWN